MTPSEFDTFEKSFLKLATTWLACSLAVMGGTPETPQHVPVTNFHTLNFAMLGCVDYSWEMRFEARRALEKCRNGN